MVQTRCHVQDGDPITQYIESDNTVMVRHVYQVVPKKDTNNQPMEFVLDFNNFTSQNVFLSHAPISKHIRMKILWMFLSLFFAAST